MTPASDQDGEREATIAAIRESLCRQPEPGDIHKQQLWLEFLLADIDRRDTPPQTNMYGCTPCPKCKDTYRWPTQYDTIVCDDCGYSEPAGPPFSIDRNVLAVAWDDGVRFAAEVLRSQVYPKAEAREACIDRLLDLIAKGSV